MMINLKSKALSTSLPSKRQKNNPKRSQKQKKLYKSLILKLKAYLFKEPKNSFACTVSAGANTTSAQPTAKISMARCSNATKTTSIRLKSRLSPKKQRRKLRKKSYQTIKSSSKTLIFCSVLNLKISLLRTTRRSKISLGSELHDNIWRLKSKCLRIVLFYHKYT